MTTSAGEPERPAPARQAARWAVRFFKALALLVALCLVAFVIFYFWASGGDSDDRLEAPGQLLDNPAGAPPPAPGDITTLTAVTFNIGYARGPAGDDSGPWTAEHIRLHLDAIAQQLMAAEADVVLMQEVDLGAARTHDIDEARYLLAKLGWRHGSCVTTWEKNYVPFPYWPPSRHYGRMKSGQCVLSRHPIESTTRHRLPQPESNPFWRNAFYLHRAIDHATLRIGKDLYDVFNVHLEAFDADNRMQQARLLVELVARTARSGRVIVAGDFNTLPVAAAQRKGFLDEPAADFSGDTTHDIVAQGLPSLREVLPDASVFTFPADKPTRRLDYIWHGAGLVLESARVLSAPPGPWSDHLPVWARWRLSAP